MKEIITRNQQENENRFEAHEKRLQDLENEAV